MTTHNIPITGEIKDILTPNPVPPKVRSSRFGCLNCLWFSCECQAGSMYKPKAENDIECRGYNYYD